MPIGSDIGREQAEDLLEEHEPEHRPARYIVRGGTSGSFRGGTVVSRSPVRASIRAALKYGGFPFEYIPQFDRFISRRGRRRGRRR